MMLRAGTWDAPASKQGTVEVESGASDVVLRMGKHIEGDLVSVRVLDPGKAPVPRVRVRVAEYGSTFEVSGARFEMTRDSLRHGALEITDPRDETGEPLPLAPARVEGGFGQGPATAEIEIRLAHLGVLAGRVTDADGVGIADVLLSAKGPTESRARTDASGAFRFDGIGSGTYDVDALVPPEFVEPPSRKVDAGAESIEIRLRRGTRPTLVVVDDSGLAVVGATAKAVVAPRNGTLADAFATALGEGIGQALAEVLMRRNPPGTDADGRIRLQRTLDPDLEHMLTVHPPRERADLAPRTLDGWRPRDQTVVLAPGRTVSGVVRSPSGIPVPSALVLVTTEDGVTSVGADAYGRFEAEDLPPGRLRLAASRPSVYRPLTMDLSRLCAPRTGPETVATPGDREVVVVLDPGGTLALRLLDPPGELDVAVLLVSEDDPFDAILADKETDERSATLTFRGLDPDRVYSLWIPPTGLAPDRSLWLGGLSMSAKVQEVRLAVGTTSRGRFERPKGVEEAWITASRGAAEHSTEVASDGSFELRGLPPGVWTFAASWVAEGGLREVEVVAEAGAAVEFPAPRVAEGTR
jgi:hypothetical protein